MVKVGNHFRCKNFVGNATGVAIVNNHVLLKPDKVESPEKPTDVYINPSYIDEKVM